MANQATAYPTNNPAAPQIRPGFDPTGSPAARSGEAYRRDFAALAALLNQALAQNADLRQQIEQLRQEIKK